MTPDPRTDVLLAHVARLESKVDALMVSLAGCQGRCAEPAAQRATLVRTVVASSVSGLVVAAAVFFFHLR